MSSHGYGVRLCVAKTNQNEFQDISEMVLLLCRILLATVFTLEKRAAHVFEGSRCQKQGQPQG